MNIKKTVQLACLFALSGILMASSCEKNCKYDFQFQQFVKIYPTLDTIRVGDTFYFEIKNPTNMYNMAESSLIEMKDYPPNILIATYKLTMNDSNKTICYETNGLLDLLLPNAGNSFDYMSIEGKWRKWGKEHHFIEYNVINKNFVHKTAIIAKDTGQYLFLLVDYNAYYSGTSIAAFETDCSKRWYLTQYTVNDGNCNTYLLDNIGINLCISNHLRDETEKYNFKYGSWNVVVIP